MNDADQEALELLAVLKDQTIGALLRTAVREFVERESDKQRPFSIRDSTTLSSMLGMGTDELVSSAFFLRGIVPETAPISAVYLLVETERRECYVGSSVAFRKRVASHLSGIRSGKHENSSLESWSVDSTVVVVIAPVTREQIRKVEQEWITRLKEGKEFTLTNERQSFDVVRRSSRPTTTDKTAVLQPPTVTSPIATNEPASKKLTKEEAFHKDFIIVDLLPILEDEKSSQEVLKALARAASYGTEEEKWAIAFIKQYNSPWLSKLAASGRFHAIEKLLA